MAISEPMERRWSLQKHHDGQHTNKLPFSRDDSPEKVAAVLRRLQFQCHVTKLPAGPSASI